MAQTSPPSSTSTALTATPEPTNSAAAKPGTTEATQFPPQTFLHPTEDVDPAAIESAHQERIANFPPAQPIDPNAQWTTERQAIEASRLFAQSPVSPTAVLPDSERARLPATAALVHYQELADAFLGGARIGGDPDISLDRPVWVVVVHGTIRNDSLVYGESIEAATHDVYTVVYDAPTGALIMYASGGDAFASGLRPVSTVQHNW